MHTIQTRELLANSQERAFTLRIGPFAVLSADRFELEQSATMRLLGNVELGIDASRTPSFAVKLPNSGGVTLRLMDLVITAEGAEPDNESGVLRLLGEVRIRQEQPAARQ